MQAPRFRFKEQTLRQTAGGVPGRTGEGQWEGQEEHGEANKLGGTPLAVLRLSGPPGLAPGPPLVLPNSLQLVYLRACQGSNPENTGYYRPDWTRLKNQGSTTKVYRLAYRKERDSTVQAWFGHT